MRAAVYCRISKDDEGYGLGVKRQEVDCRGLCERNGWDVGEVFVDNDLASKARVRRPAYERMVAAIRAGEFDALACYHPDRLTRRPLELEALIDVIEATGVKVSTVAAGDYDLSTASGRMVARILGSTNRHEVERMAERIARKKREMVESGLPVGGGKRCYGYTADKLHVVPHEAEVLRDVAARIVAGASYRSQVLRLNAEGLVPDSGAWSGPALRSVLTGHRIVGLATHNGVVVADAQWPAILDRETWTILRNLIEARRRGPRKSARYLLTGVAMCGRCGTLMYRHPQSGRRPDLYSCNQRDPSACNACYVIADRLEEWVTDQFDGLLPGLAAATSAALGPTSGDLAGIERAISEHEAQLAEFAARNLAGDLELVEWNVLRSGVRDSLTKLRADRTRLLTARAAPGAVLPADLLADWRRGEVAERNGILRSLVRVVVEPAGRRRVSVGDRARVEPLL